MGEGIDLIGGDFGGIFKTLAQAGAGVVDTVEADREAGQAKTDAEDKLRAAITADVNATHARYRALVSKSAADEKAYRDAAKKQDEAGAKVPDSVKADRIAAAQQAVDDAQAAILVGSSQNQSAYAGVSHAAVNPSSGAVADVDARRLMLKAAQETLSKAKGEPVDTSDGSAKKEGSFLSKAVVGPVRVWHGLVALVGGVGGYLLLRKK